jgi:pimeloyl-ACP methyl ester carboxylesterase
MTSETHSIVKQNKAIIQKSTIHAVGSVLHLAMHSAKEVTDLVAEMHSTITHMPSPLNKKHQPNARFAPFPYRIVSNSFALLARLSHQMTAKTEFSTLPVLRTQAALNGVCGDKLEAWNSPLATPLTLRDEQGKVLDTAQWAQQPAKGHVLFLHGLCHSDLEWNQSANHRQFSNELSEQGYQRAWLRYNTGRSISANGEDLAALLEQHFTDQGSPIWLIGHSMGGLLIRSASHYAAMKNQTWLARLSHAAYLGTPHLGAPWEVAGNKLNNILNFTPYTRPLMRLGNIRSQGIRDLRESQITADQKMPALAEKVSHLLLATSWSEAHTENWIGDGIVPVSSALAQDKRGEVLSAPQLKRVLLNDINHIAIMNDERVYQELRKWLMGEHIEKIEQTAKTLTLA